MGVMRHHVRSRPQLRRTIGQLLLFPGRKLTNIMLYSHGPRCSPLTGYGSVTFTSTTTILPGRSFLFGLSPLFTWT